MKNWLVMGAYLIMGSAFINAAQANTTSVYVGISLNKKLDPNSATVAPGPFLTKYFDPLFTSVGGNAKNNLHMTFFHGTAARVACYATRSGGKKNIKCYATGEPITPQEGTDLNERLQATYTLALNTVPPANPLTLNLVPRYKESTANKYFVMLDVDANSRDDLANVLHVFRLFLSHKKYDFHHPIPKNLIHFPLEEEIEVLSNQAQALTDDFRARAPNPQALQYVQIVKSGVPVSLDKPLCCYHPDQGTRKGCIDINSSLDSSAPERTKCFIIGAKKWYTGEKSPSLHVTLADHTSGFPSKQNLENLIKSTVTQATKTSKKTLALTHIKDVWNKIPENVIKGSIFLTVTRDMLCVAASGTVNPKVKNRLIEILSQDSQINGKSYTKHLEKACRTPHDHDLYFNDDGRLREYGQYRPSWDSYIPEKSTLFNNFDDLTHWLIDHRIRFDLTEFDFHQ
ncbi:MAG: hypothetical protein K0M45_09725 [Candidatus Paracaedibacteraceae bacterium]|nr:hypothetical protein [Candidatus Paracaedibacteraceae bacterium]